MGKKIKRKEKDKNAIKKRKDVSAIKSKSVIDKLAKLETKNTALKEKQKGLKEQWKTMRKQYAGLTTQHKAMEKRAAGLRKHISRLQTDGQEVKDSLAAEVSNRIHTGERLDSIESRQGTDLEQVNSLHQQLQQHQQLTDEVKTRLESMQQLAGESEHLKGEIEYLHAGKLELDSEIGKLSTEINGLKSSHQDLGSSTGNLTGMFDGVNKRLEDNLEQHKQIEASIEDLNQGGTSLSSQLDNQHDQIQRLVQIAQKLDQETNQNADSHQALQEQMGGFGEELKTATEQLSNKGTELDKKNRYLDSQHQQLAARHSRLTRGVVVAGILLLALAGVGYWVKYRALEQKTLDSSVQIEQLSILMQQQKAGTDDPASVGGALSGKLEQISQVQEKMGTNLLDLAEAQDKTTAEIMQLQEGREEAEQQLEQHASELTELTSKQAEWQAAMEQQEEKLRLLQVRPQGKRTKPTTTAVSQNNLRDKAWLQDLNPKHYTLQILGAYDATVVSRFAQRTDLHKPMVMHKGEFKQRDWYVLLYGDFSSLREAKAAIQKLPKDIQTHKPWVRRISTIQKTL